ncbi:hypothetical protein [Streptomyces sp. NPDC050504]|uniref:hypothetical protein n=1 Tax=Streptomyces sp. NPDC050504 TaxID=3365618 RepID=UPI003787A6AB
MKQLSGIDANAPEAVRDLAGRLRTALEAAGYTGVRDAAAACGLGRTTVSDALGGEKAPTWPTVRKLLEACRLTPDTGWKRAQEAAKSAEEQGKQRVRGVSAPPRTASAPLPGTFTIRAPYGELPAQVRGRDALLERLREALFTDGACVQVLHGLGGNGKTTVALALARCAKDRDVQVFWVSAVTHDTLLTGMRQVARDLGVPDDLADEAWAGRASATDLVWNALDAAERPWLLVVDNVDEPAFTASEHGVPGDGTGWIRSSRAGLTVVTSRVGDPRAWGREATCHPVGVLSAEDGAAVLLDLAPGAGQVADARLLAERLDGLPLALHLAGSYLARTGRGAGLLRGLARDFAGYARELDRRGARLLDEGAGPNGERRARRLVGQTWEMSLDLLARQGMPEARWLMRLLSCFARAPFPLWLLDSCVLERFPCPPEPERYEAALEALVALGLVRIEEVFPAGSEAEDDWPCVTAHALVLEANALNAAAAPARERALVWRGAAAVAEHVGELAAGPRNWNGWRALVPHVVAGLCAVPREDHGTLLPFVRAALAATDYAVALNHLPLCRQLSLLMVEAAGELPQDCPEVSRVRRNRVHLTEGNDGVGLARQLLDEQLARWGADHVDTLNARRVWGRTLFDQGRWEEAEREFRAVADGHVRLGALDAALLARAYVVQALEPQGRARACADEAALLAAALDERPETEFSVRHQVAHALDAAGLLTKAEGVHRRMLAELEAAGAEDRPLYLNLALHCADNLVRQDRAVDALALVDRLLSRYLPGPAAAVPPPWIAELAGRKLDLLHAAGRLDEAVPELRALLDSCGRTPDGTTRASTSVRLLLAETLRELGDATASLAELDALESAPGDEADDAPPWLVPLYRARCLCTLGDCADAVTHYDVALAAASGAPDAAARIREESADCRSAAP